MFGGAYYAGNVYVCKAADVLLTDVSDADGAGPSDLTEVVDVLVEHGYGNGMDVRDVVFDEDGTMLILYRHNSGGTRHDCIMSGTLNLDQTRTYEVETMFNPGVNADVGFTTWIVNCMAFASETAGTPAGTVLLIR
jgi:hypothetical protein